jgi:hypothetical protein
VAACFRTDLASKLSVDEDASAADGKPGHAIGLATCSAILTGIAGVVMEEHCRIGSSRQARWITDQQLNELKVAHDEFVQAVGNLRDERDGKTRGVAVTRVDPMQFKQAAQCVNRESPD